MKKKLIISASVLIGLIVIVLTLCFTVFTVKTVQIDFRTSTTQSFNDKDIIEDSEIEFGKCLLFMSKENYIQNIEKSNPYIKVINIEKTFPSSLIIHCAERQSIYAIEDETKTIYCDEDFKVLQIKDSLHSSTKENEILLKNIEVSDDIAPGDFLDINQKALKQLYPAMLENSLGLNQFLGFCKEIEPEVKVNDLTSKEETHLTITTFTNRKIRILNIDSNLNFKIQRMLQALPKLYEMLLDNGDYTEEEVNKCTLVIGNQILDESELYVHIYLDVVIIESPHKTN